MGEKWMQEAVKKPGSFTAWCKSQGLVDKEGKVTAACIAAGKKSKDPKTRKRAVLAETFARERPKKKGDLLKVYVQAKVNIDFNELTYKVEDFPDYEAKIETEDYSTYYGRLTRAGPFEYPDGLKKKDYNNLRDIFSKTSHLPVFGSREYGSHKEGLPTTHLVGFATNWDYNDKDEGIYGDVFFFKDIGELSDLKKPVDLPVSIKFDDIGEGNVQNIAALHHLAVSLNKFEDDRCGLTGESCTISPKGQSIKNDGGSDSYALQTATAGSVDYLELDNWDTVGDMGNNKQVDKDAGKPTPDENKIRSEIDECLKSGKTEEECKMEQKRKERTGKWDQEVSGNMPKKDLEDLDITLEDLEAILDEYDDLKEENEKLKQGSSALLERLDNLEKWQKKAIEKEDQRKEEELAQLKEDLKAKGVCDTYVDNRGLEQLQDFAIGLDGLDKERYVAHLKSLIGDSGEEEEITATSLADMGKTIEDVKEEFEYLKMR